MPALATLPLAEIVFWLGVWIFCLLCLKIAQALFSFGGGVIGWVPFVGGWAKHRIEDVAHKIASTMAGAMGFADQRVAAAIHDLARLTDWVGRELSAHGNLILTLAQLLTGQLPASFLLKELHRLTHLGDQGAQALRGIGHDVLPRIKTVERGIGADVKPHLRALDRELGRIEGKVIPGLAGELHGIEHGALDLWKWVLRHPRTAATTAFAGAVAWALTHLGVTWIRCNNWRRIGREVCGTPAGDIEALIALFATTAALLDFRDLVKLAQGVEHATAEGIQAILKV